MRLPRPAPTALPARPRSCCLQAVAINPRMYHLRQHIMQLRELIGEEGRRGVE